MNTRQRRRRKPARRRRSTSSRRSCSTTRAAIRPISTTRSISATAGAIPMPRRCSARSATSSTPTRNAGSTQAGRAHKLAESGARHRSPLFTDRNNDASPAPRSGTALAQFSTISTRFVAKSSLTMSA
ncbi:hypothetical protein EMIT0111MI5_30519 [Burkholderia sp. IT-111MI5]